jgi:hypothetical protein
MAAIDWTQTMEFVNDFRKRIPAEQFYELRYEDFLRQPVQEMRKLAEFLGIEDSHGRLALWLETELPKDVKQNNFGKWKSRLSRRELYRFDRIAGPLLAEYGYETLTATSKPPNLIEHLYWVIENRIRKLLRTDYWNDTLYRTRLYVNDLAQVKSFPRFLRRGPVT